MRQIKKKEILKSISSFKNNLKVLIIGDIMLDKYIWGDVSRISPEAPVPVVHVHDQTFGMGGAANVAQNILSLGGTPLIASIIGDDRDGALLKNLFEEVGISTGYLHTVPERTTTTKMRVIGGHHQQMLRIDWEEVAYISPAILEGFKKVLREAMKQASVIAIQDYNKGILSPSLIRWIIEEARKQDIPIYVDPKFENFNEYKNLSLIKPNEKELGSFFHKEINGENVLELGNKLLRDSKALSVLVTRGAKGMLLFQKDREPVMIPAYVHDVYDVSGAGDTVLAVLSLSKALGISLEEASLIATYAASIVISKVGPHSVTKHELQGLIEKNFIDFGIPETEKIEDKAKAKKPEPRVKEKAKEAIKKVEKTEVVEEKPKVVQKQIPKVEKEKPQKPAVQKVAANKPLVLDKVTQPKEIEKPKQETKPKEIKPKIEIKPKEIKPKLETKPKEIKPKIDIKSKETKPKQETKLKETEPKEETKQKEIEPKQEIKPIETKDKVTIKEKPAIAKKEVKAKEVIKEKPIPAKKPISTPKAEPIANNKTTTEVKPKQKPEITKGIKAATKEIQEKAIPVKKEETSTPKKVIKATPKSSTVDKKAKK